MTELALRAGPVFANRGGLRGAWLGQALHVAYQRHAAEQDPAFEAEVALQESFLHCDVRVSLRGRADGIRPEADGFLVEELKLLSARREAWLPAFRLQAGLYARMLARTRSAAVRAELVWLGGDAPIREPLDASPEEVERALTSALDHCLAELEHKLALRVAWRTAAGAVCFPHPSLRPGQPEIVASVESALEQGEQLLVEAATGSGKTAAILTPALRHAMASGRRLFLLTASTLQQHLALETLERLSPVGAPLVSRLRAKGRMCTRGDLLCHESICESAAGYTQKRDAGRLVERCFDARGLALPDAVFALGGEARACPYELQLDAAREALVTLCDVNYAIDPRVALPELRDPAQLRETILVIDEIHQLPERARSALTVRLDGRRVREAIAASALGSSVLHREMREACEGLHARLEALLADAGGLPEGAWLAQEPPCEALEAVSRELQRLAFDAIGSQQGGLPSPAVGAFLDVGFALERFLRIGAGEPGFVALLGRDEGEPQLERYCRDPSPALGRLFGACHALVGCSATLSPPEFFAAQLGLDRARAVHRRIPPADPGERRALVIDASVTTTEKTRTREVPRIARRLAALCDAVPGNCLALFPSHAFLEAVRAALPALGRRVCAQSRSDSEPERRGLVDELRRASDVLLLAVAGGALAEGVDYAGARLAAVAVVGPCLPAVDAHRALLEEHYAERFERGFELAYALPGMIRVVQSAGRLLPGESDRGVIALFDRRFLREPYRGLLPADWTAGREPEQLVGDPSEVARAFFARR